MDSSPVLTPAAAFHVQVPENNYASPAMATTGPSLNALKRVACGTSGANDSAYSSGTSVTRAVGEGGAQMDEKREEQAEEDQEAVSDGGREKKRARRSDAGLEPVN